MISNKLGVIIVPFKPIAEVLSHLLEDSDTVFNLTI